MHINADHNEISKQNLFNALIFIPTEVSLSDIKDHASDGQGDGEAQNKDLDPQKENFNSFQDEIIIIF